MKKAAILFFASASLVACKHHKTTDTGGGIVMERKIDNPNDSKLNYDPQKIEVEDSVTIDSTGVLTHTD